MVWGSSTWERTIPNLDERVYAHLFDMVAVRLGLSGLIAFVLVVAFAVIFAIRGMRQIRHSLRFKATESPEDTRIARAMGILNSVTHPVWMFGTIVLLIVG